MTLRLLLMRHGKSDWNANFASDHDRPLANRGLKAAQQMGELLFSAGQLPSHILSSSALRAHQTAQNFVEGAKETIPIQLADELYDSSPQQVLQRIQQETHQDSLMVIGHEPIWSGLATKLIGGGRIAFPTAAIARIDFSVTQWPGVSFGDGELRWLLQPKFFRNFA